MVVKPRTSIIIPVFNQSALTAQCLNALAAQQDCEVIVVDDASEDDTTRVLEEFKDRVHVVRHQVNLGFATACNDGAGKATAADYLVFLNNDTVPQPGWLEALIRYADHHPAAAVVGARLLYPDDTIQHAGVVICQDLYPRHVYTGFPADHPAVNKSRQFQIVTAACMLVRRKVFEQSGGFDTAFRNGFEDVDFCLRIRERGLEVHYCPDSVAYHLESVSPGRFKSDHENVRLYRERWMPRVQPDDVRYYFEDSLLELSYEGSFPVRLRASPFLATLDSERASRAERLLARRSRELAEARRDNTRLTLELGHRPGESAELRYQELRRRIREVVLRTVPAGATIAVVSKGDSALLDFPGRRGWHFPQNARSVYAGHHPTDSAEAITDLEHLRRRGADYLVIPAPSLWWLDCYRSFHEHLEANFTRLAVLESQCVIYRLVAPNSRLVSFPVSSAPAVAIMECRP